MNNCFSTHEFVCIFTIYYFFFYKDIFMSDQNTNEVQSNEVQSNEVQSNEVQGNEVQSNEVQGNEVQSNAEQKEYYTPKYELNSLVSRGYMKDAVFRLAKRVKDEDNLKKQYDDLKSKLTDLSSAYYLVKSDNLKKGIEQEINEINEQIKALKYDPSNHYRLIADRNYFNEDLAFLEKYKVDKTFGLYKGFLKYFTENASKTASSKVVYHIADAVIHHGCVEAQSFYINSDGKTIKVIKFGYFQESSDKAYQLQVGIYDYQTKILNRFLLHNEDVAFTQYIARHKGDDKWDEIDYIKNSVLRDRIHDRFKNLIVIKQKPTETETKTKRETETKTEKPKLKIPKKSEVKKEKPKLTYIEQIRANNEKMQKARNEKATKMAMAHINESKNKE